MLLVSKSTEKLLLEPNLLLVVRVLPPNDQLWADIVKLPNTIRQATISVNFFMMLGLELIKNKTDKVFTTEKLDRCLLAIVWGKTTPLGFKKLLFLCHFISI
jgi:hypothetical protein